MNWLDKKVQLPEYSRDSIEKKNTSASSKKATLPDFFNLKERTYFTANATTQYELLIQVEKLFTIVLKKIILHIVY